MKSWKQDGASIAIIDNVWSAQLCDCDEPILPAWDKALTQSKKHESV